MTDMHGLGTANLRRPLEGFRVLDLTVALAGPYCTLLLAGMGAEVIKVEGPKGGDIARTNPPYYGPDGFHFDRKEEGDVSVSILARARNKKSITLDLKTEAGREIFMRLAKQADIVVENMSEGAVQRLGVGYQEVRAANDRIVYASIAGLGEPNPFPGLKVMDIIVQALSGLMAATGLPDGPPIRVGIPIADLLAPLYATSGIMAALLQRGRTGLGQHVKVSMLDCLASLLAVDHFDVYQREGLSPRTGNFKHRAAPFGLYAARDGYVAIAAAKDSWAWAVFEAMGRPELKDDPRFQRSASRVVNMHELNVMIEAWTKSRLCEEITHELFVKRQAPCVKMRSVEEVLDDPLLHAKGVIQKLFHPSLGALDAVGPGVPIAFSDATVVLDRPAPELGADNREVLGGLLGLTEAEFDALKAQGVI
jgi:formyl-CoA transferase